MANLSIPVSFDSQPDESIQLSVYAFTRSGKFMEKQEVKSQKATFKDFGIPTQDLRFFVLPTPTTELKSRLSGSPSLQDMQRLQAYEPIIQWEKGLANTLPIPDKFPLLWRWVICRVSGRVVKRFNILGFNQDRGICRARVHICEVDRIRFWIDRIPDYVIKRIPDIIEKPRIPIHDIIRYPIPIPNPDPGPIKNITHSNRLAKTPIKLAALGKSAQALKSEDAILQQALPELSPSLKAQLSSGNIQQTRNLIVNNFPLLHPYFCAHPFFWPFFYRYDELTTEYTDMNGRFDAKITYLAGGDIPDLYFWVEYFLNGSWTTVYRPSIPCHTYWDYRCGTEVTIRVDDDRVRWECSEVIPGELIWLKSVGHGVSVSHIRQDNYNQSSNNNPAVITNRIGMTDASVANGPTAPGDFKRPFGGQLYLMMQFSSGLPNSQASYFRWKYCKTHSATLEPINLSPNDGDFTPISSPISKQYSYEYKDIFLVKHLAYDYVHLGPVNKGSESGLYIIPPVNPSMAPFNIPIIKNPNWDQNTVGMIVDTNSLPGDGVYQFRLEVFNSNGDLIGNYSRSLFQVPEPSAFSPSVLAPDNMLTNLTGSGLGATASGMKLSLRIDNQRCEAEIYKIKKNGSEVTTDCCGFINYGNAAANLTVGFTAAHPHDLAEFDFSITKGTCNDPGMSLQVNAAGDVAGNVNNYIRNGSGKYVKNFFPPTLLGICSSGGKAAFAENLGVYALAIDGNSRLSGYDAHDVAAFALEP
ncbi:MAG: hypothetical protein JST36_08645 [Bacteroidetes bacterium]|nr:hypothetical protein [Bacteroidota bacterium]